MNLLNEYKELYLHEIEHSDRLNNRISTCLTVLTILGSGEVYLWNTIASRSNFSLEISIIDWKLTCLSLLALISSCMLIVSIQKFIKAYSGYDYDYFPVEGFKSFVDKTMSAVDGFDKGTEIAEAHITGMMERTYIKCAINNRAQNTYKNQNHRTTNIWLVRTFISLLVAFAFSLLCVGHA